MQDYFAPAVATGACDVGWKRRGVGHEEMVTPATATAIRRWRKAIVRWAPMRKSLLEILCCPVCKGDLELRATVETDEEVQEGSLFCAKCPDTFPIEDGIPNLLPPDLRNQ